MGRWVSVGPQADTGINKTVWEGSLRGAFNWFQKGLGRVRMPEKGREAGSGREPRDIAKGTQKTQQLPNLLQPTYIRRSASMVTLSWSSQQGSCDKLLSSRSFPRWPQKTGCTNWMGIEGHSRPGRSHFPHVTDFKILLLFLKEGFLSHSLPYSITFSRQPRLHGGQATTRGHARKKGTGEETHQHLLSQRASRSHVTCTLSGKFS